MSIEDEEELAIGSRYAYRAGIDTLYKFRPYRTPMEKKWVREILESHRVYFARPDELNDKYDLRPRLKFARC